MRTENDFKSILTTFDSQIKRKTAYLINKRIKEEGTIVIINKKVGEEKKKIFSHETIAIDAYSLSRLHMCNKYHILSSFISSFFCPFFFFHQLNSTPLYHCSFSSTSKLTYVFAW
jgi:hypothetical protein